MWDTIDIDGDVTVEGLKEHFEENYNYEVTSLFAGGVMLWDSLSADDDVDEKRVSELYQEVAHRELRPGELDLIVGVDVEDLDDDADPDAEVDLPPVRIRFRSV
uniref:Ubiquitin-activating enzyme E1 C-terminal domain-containing protein n=1 Tax=Bicosoecida sp. CB-2014 TaxID=1486930 RepID=A0A7S1CKR3_9STRA